MSSRENGGLVLAKSGEDNVFDQVGSAAAVLRTTRHADTPLIDTPHSRRMVTMADYEYADLIDDQDKIRLLVDPTSTYARAAASAMGRAIDDVIIAASVGTAKTGTHGSANLTIAKLLSAKQILDEGNVDPSIPRYLVCAPDQISALLGTTQVTSSDFNTVRALATGEVNSYLGFNFIVSNRLGLDSNSHRQVFAFAGDGIKLAMGKEPSARIDERSDKSYATQVYYCMTLGASRMEESKVVEIACSE